METKAFLIVGRALQSSNPVATFMRIHLWRGTGVHAFVTFDCALRSTSGDRANQIVSGFGVPNVCQTEAHKRMVLQLPAFRNWNGLWYIRMGNPSLGLVVELI